VPVDGHEAFYAIYSSVTPSAIKQGKVEVIPLMDLGKRGIRLISTSCDARQLLKPGDFTSEPEEN
jgi:hypothetical protein